MRLLLLLALCTGCTLQLSTCMLDYDFDEYWVDNVCGWAAVSCRTARCNCHSKRYGATSGVQRQDAPAMISPPLGRTHWSQGIAQGGGVSQRTPRFRCLSTPLQTFPGVIQLRGTAVRKVIDTTTGKEIVLDIDKCTGVFITPTTILTGGRCISIEYNTRAEDPRFCCGIYPEPITTTVHVLHPDGSDTMIGSLRTVQYLYWPNEGYNIAIVSVRLNAKANSVNLKYYPVRREISPVPFDGVLVTAGPNNLTTNDAGDAVLWSSVESDWYRMLGANVTIADESTAVERPGACVSEYTSGEMILSRISTRDGREFNRAGVCTRWGEIGGPLFARPMPGEYLWPQYENSSSEWVIVGIVDQTGGNPTSDGDNLCSDVTTYLTNIKFHQEFIVNKLPVIDTDSYPPRVVCPSTTPSPSPTASVSASATASVSPSITPSASMPPPPPPPINWFAILAATGILLVSAACAWRIAKKRERRYKVPTQRAKQVGKQFAVEAAAKSKPVPPPCPEEVAESIKQAHVSALLAQRATMAERDAEKREARQKRRQKAAARRAQQAKQSQQQRVSLAADRHRQRGLPQVGAHGASACRFNYEAAGYRFAGQDAGSAPPTAVVVPTST